MRIALSFQLSNVNICGLSVECFGWVEGPFHPQKDGFKQEKGPVMESFARGYREVALSDPAPADLTTFIADSDSFTIPSI